MEQLDARARTLLRTLVESYIEDGHPVGSRTLSRQSGLELSAATVRNVMSDLEEMGFIASPHTSSGRIPTAQGYRFFVDTLLTVQPLDAERIQSLRGELRPDQPQRVISAASQMLSRLSRLAGVVVVPRRDALRMRQVEFIRLSECRVLLILVTMNGDVQNRVLQTREDYDNERLAGIAQLLNEHFSGMTLREIQERITDELRSLRGDINELMNATVETGEAADTSDEHIVLSGETNLLDFDDLSSNMEKLRGLFRLFEQKTGLLQLLEHSIRAEGVQIFIGGESGLDPLDGCSVITAPYEVDGQVVGSLGVIGPTRMAYNRVIPLVDMTSRLLSNALSNPSTSEPRQP